MPIEAGVSILPDGLNLYFKKDLRTFKPCQWTITKRFARREYTVHIDKYGNTDIRVIEKQ